ncbi:CaiB/BaiF CoA transferase family protein [Methylobacterium gregans]|uniref:Acetyl-CoA:oxalate CoA-transferase n=1 Tax=Methylobacterium gregans TaxID=374424 RepID=A0AA37MA77_9HYPH|nr:CoA transferase [Methylobacterium gregans]MDQ0520684.1 crotonobetainyl-CoA:carnitine CoA-transferase CaiB-like acyl-CoA transferase [Methylobacterium gregans]GJD78420.1 Acetyl-CoA:oxalate CoA-transferase [Methylobacterium gregans]GLS53367.1 CoA transferase [Methylobacterium gregans]
MLFDPDDLPLAGIRVLDLSRVLAGPWCAQVLGDLGADVIKVEHPERGDDTRDWGLRTGPSNTSYFDSVNRNKRSIGVDLADPEGLALVRDLARQSDVVVQNFKTGGADRLGLGYAALSAENPRLIYCSVSGYASDGPEATRPGYDLVIQGESGLMALNGEAERPPLKFGLAAVDLFTGQFAAQGVLAALYQRERTGRGRLVELALFDCGVALTSYYGLEAMVQGRDPARYGNAHPSIVPYGVFEAGDGPIVLTVGNNAQYRRFCEQVLERPDLCADPRFATNLDRSKNRAVFVPVLEAELAKWSRADLLVRLASAGIPCGEVLGLHEALTSARARSAGLVIPQGAGAEATAHVLAPPYRLDGARLPVRRMPPTLDGSGADIRATLPDRPAA